MPLVIRTDYTDDATWREVVAALERAVEGEREWQSVAHLVEDRRWDGVTGDEAGAAAARDEELSVVFLADGVTMRSPLRPLLALDLGADDDEDLDPTYYQELIDSPQPREVRVLPDAVHMVHGEPPARQRGLPGVRGGRGRRSGRGCPGCDGRIGESGLPSALRAVMPPGADRPWAMPPPRSRPAAPAAPA
ncbi:DUF6924 domain-containing protein [Streptomyces parvus]|uniref:DUF6924 domain-containing protein n=1 Tax=Streptomyces parvus TaxID=66428 RepID=UPI0036365DEA